MKKNALLLFALFLLLSQGCITGQLKNGPIQIKRLDIIVQNFSGLLSLGVPLECAVQTWNGTVFIKIRDGKFRTQSDGLVLIEENDTEYMRVPDSRRGEFGCDWIMVNRSADVYSDWLHEFNPMNGSLEELPGSAFICDAAYVSPQEMDASGKLCWYFDIK